LTDASNAPSWTEDITGQVQIRLSPDNEGIILDYSSSELKADILQTVQEGQDIEGAVEESLGDAEEELVTSAEGTNTTTAFSDQEQAIRIEDTATEQAFEDALQDEAAADLLLESQMEENLKTWGDEWLNIRLDDLEVKFAVSYLTLCPSRPLQY
jgi:hypothetical protein